MVRTEVAVGTESEASMFSTSRTAPPRIGWRMSPGRIETGAIAFERGPAGTSGTSRRARVGRASARDSRTVGDGSGAASLTITVTGGVSGSGGTPSAASKYVRQLGSTLLRSWRYSSRRSRAKT